MDLHNINYYQLAECYYVTLTSAYFTPDQKQ